MRIPSSMAALVLLLLACRPLVADTPEGRVQVFVLAGQSNMEGYGHVRTLPHLADLPGGSELLGRFRAPDGSWAVRDDVFVYFHSGATVGNLGVGFGAHRDFVGPELAFGTLMGDALDAPVLLIKTAWGGKDLHFDFRPPSAGKLPYPIDPAAFAERGGEAGVGESFRHIVTDVKDCLARMGELFPALKGRGYDIVGLVWFQGWNEMFPSKGCEFERVVADYPTLYADLVQDLEHELGVTRLPSVVGEMGVDGEQATGHIVELRKRQAEIATQPRLSGKVLFVRTADLWDPRLDEMQRREGEIRRAARDRVRPSVESRLKDTLEGKSDKERRELLDRTLNETIEATDEYKAWQRDWETIAGHWECHYWGSAPTYSRIGARLAHAMQDLLAQKNGDPK
jgi:hypothetical protein